MEGSSISLWSPMVVTLILTADWTLWASADRAWLGLGYSEEGADRPEVPGVKIAWKRGMMTETRSIRKRGIVVYAALGISMVALRPARDVAKTRCQ